MPSLSQKSIDYLRAIETLSQEEESLKRAVSRTGPGGEAYDRVPTAGFPYTKNAKSFQHSAAMFFKDNGLLLAGIAVGGVAVWAGRTYWKHLFQ